MPSSNNQASKYLTEGLRYKDMVGLVKPEIHVDEFASKMGDDDDIVVLSFYVRDNHAATDMVNWFEKGYDFIIDADKSPGELKPNRYLVYVEMKRRSNLVKHLDELLNDMENITEFTAAEWTLKYKEARIKFDVDAIEKLIPLSPKAYRAQTAAGLNEFRQQAGLPHKAVYEHDAFTLALQRQAGLK